jgi:hypothetical protein
VRWIGRRGRNALTTLLIKAPHHSWILRPGLWRGEPLNGAPLPQAPAATKGGQPAISRDTCSGQDHDTRIHA